MGPNPVSLCTWLLASPSSSAITVGVAASAGLQFWEPAFTFGGQKWLMAVTFPDLPDPGIEPASSVLAGGFFTTEPPGKPQPMKLPNP